MSEPERDLERLLSLLEDFGIPYLLEQDDMVEAPASQSVRVGQDSGIGIFGANARTHPKVTGYQCFYACWEFDGQGKFVRFGVWE